MIRFILSIFKPRRALPNPEQRCIIHNNEPRRLIRRTA